MKLRKTAKSVASITASLHGTIADLERHADDQLKMAAAQADAAAAAEVARRGHADEHERAAAVADNIRTLLSV